MYSFLFRSNQVQNAHACTLVNKQVRMMCVPTNKNPTIHHHSGISNMTHLKRCFYTIILISFLFNLATASKPSHMRLGPNMTITLDPPQIRFPNSSRTILIRNTTGEGSLDSIRRICTGSLGSIGNGILCQGFILADIIQRNHIQAPLGEG